MMRIYRILIKRMLGVRYERALRNALVSVILFWSLYTAGIRIGIAPAVLYLMISAVTAGTMWKALLSGEQNQDLPHLFMLPFDGRELILSYTAALGTYTFFMRTLMLLAVLSAVRGWNFTEMLTGILCILLAVILPVCGYVMVSYRRRGTSPSEPAAYCFCPSKTVKSSENRSAGNMRGCILWRYLFRYLMSHGNYVTNLAVLWGLACVLPFFLGKAGGIFVLPMGLAILSINTPLQILLSCDPATERTVRLLPGQQRAFFLPYGCFLFLYNLVCYGIFLTSWECVNGGVTMTVLLTALVFALQSAAGAVLLEIYFPLKGWRVESDLWHHPRKYVIPSLLLLEGTAVGSLLMMI